MPVTRRCRRLLPVPVASRLRKAQNWSENDAYHIAIAVTSTADILVSWNFRHIVRRKTRDIVNMINTAVGYPHMEIVSPGELL